ncbi:hypothetical protein, partial [Salmonella enterica]|uniref:hypothetical protein n=1 Tax=Salmonella enterica TaxID=28901 RepID=UPI001A7E1CB2
AIRPPNNPGLKNVFIASTTPSGKVNVGIRRTYRRFLLSGLVAAFSFFLYGGQEWKRLVAGLTFPLGQVLSLDTRLFIIRK